MPGADGSFLQLSLLYTNTVKMKLRTRLVIAAFAVLPAMAILAFNGNTAAIEFTEVAQRAGIRAELRCGGPEKRWIPEANGTGAAWLDYDNDGLMDLLIVNGSTIDDLWQIVGGRVPPARPGSLYLYHNLGNGR